MRKSRYSPHGGMLPAVGICLVLIALAVVAWYWLASPPRARFGSATSIGASAPSPLETESARSSAQKNPPTPVTSAAKANLKTEQLAKKPANFDDRKEISAAPSETQHRAWEALTREVPGVQVQFDAVTGAPNHILATGRFLAGPAVPGAGVYDSVLRFIDDHAALFGHGANALGDARITREDVTAQNGMRTVVWQQQVDDIPVYRTILKANLTKDGALVTLGSHFMRDATAATQMDPFERAALIAQPPVDARQAVSLAAAHLDDNVAPEQVIGLSPPENAERKQRFAAPKLSDTVAQLSWLPLNADSARLVWDVTLMSLQRREMFRILVDAKNGKVLLRTSLTADISDATYRVYADGASLQPFDSPTPFSPGYATPQTMQPAEASRSLITTPALDTTASPAGWISDGGTETFGNNVDAHLDLSDVNPAYGMGTHAVSIARVFDFSLDLSQEPSTYQSASVTELFYLCNWYHDKLYALGFTESAGNFQQNNFGRGGLEGDAVLADAQDGGGVNNANFSTPSDGSPGRMQMYLFSGPSPGRDGDLDAEIVFHEHTHGLSNRLVGGGVGITAYQTSGMGEGWSDFYALCLLSQPADDVNGNYAAGAYVSDQFFGESQNYYFGIRRYPYSTDMTKNPLTFKDIDPALASAHAGVPYNAVFGSPDVNSSEVHNQGEVWCIALWEARAQLINKLGSVAGNQMILQIVTDGMKLSPADPTFLEARDAIIQADLVNNGGANRSELWAAFAKRGMGANAIAPPNNTTSGVTESYDLPDDLSVEPATSFVSIGEAGGPFAPTAKNYTLKNNGTASFNWTASANAAWFDLSSASGSLTAGESTTVTATINAGAAGLSNGLYGATVTFTNTNTGAEFVRNVTLRVGQVDYFTELFDAGTPRDINNQSFLFVPNATASGYSVTRNPVSDFPTDPAGGIALPMSDDSFAPVTPLGGRLVQLYGVSYSSLFVGSNGYITFGAGDTQYAESLEAHFNLPRISAMMDDLAPVTDQVTWRQTGDRLAVTWQGVHQYGTSDSNNFQIELFFDGRIRITQLAVAATDGLIGLSRGTGVPPDFLNSNFSAYPLSNLSHVVDHFEFSAIPSPQYRGVSFPITLTAKDASNATLDNYDGTLALAATGAAPVLPGQVSDFAHGVWTGSVLVDAQASGVILTATDGWGHSGSSNPFDVGAAPDYFTELFDDGKPNDTGHQSWLFTPDGSPGFYAVRRAPSVNSFPTDPSGGTTLSLADDGHATLTLSGGAEVKLYGVSYSTFYVGSNGYVTFGSGDDEYSESLAQHFSKPRVAALFVDLNPENGGSITWKQLADRVAVTFQAVPEYSEPNSNNFQVELFFDGRIRITCLDIAATHGLIGLSQGLGAPDNLVQSDFSSYPTFAPRVVTDAATAVLATSATLNGSFNPNGQMTNAEFDFGLTNTYGGFAGVTLSPDDGPSAQATGINVTGLAPGTIYHFRASATNPGGTTNGNDLTFTTLTLQQNWRLQYFGTIANAGSAADSADPDGDGNSNLLEYVAGLAPDDPASRFKIRVEQVSGQPGQKAIVFSPLVPDRTYVVKSKAALNDADWTPLANSSTSDNNGERTVIDLDAATGAKFYTVEITAP